MAIIGQIIYNLESEDGYLHSSRELDPDQRVNSKDNASTYEQEKINIYEGNIVTKCKTKKFLRIGIQGQPGVRFILNGNKQIVIGNTGIYELDEGISIFDFKFIQPKDLELQEEVSAAVMDEGCKKMDMSVQKRDESIAQLNNKYSNKEKDAAYYNTLNEILNTYQKEYKIGAEEFERGHRGVWKENGLLDLKNIIIDYLCE